MTDLIWRPDTARLDSLELWEHNPKFMTETRAKRLLASWEELGQFQTLAVGPGGECYDGHQRIQTLVAAGYAGDYEVQVLRASRPITDQERRRLIISSTETTVGRIDWDAIAAWPTEELLDWGFDATLLAEWNDDAANLALMLEAEKTEEVGGNDDDAQEGDRLALYAPDAMFPSSNEWDVPDLLPELQADFLELPLTKWGDGSRKKTMRGTYHFYTEDYKFEALWKDPLDLINSQCVAMVEPNCSTNEQMPASVGLWGIYRKRWLARYAQEYGIKVWVDLNVDRKFERLNLLGVPKGWRAFCTRGLDKYIDLIEGDYALACECSAPEQPRFLVYGGGEQVKALCKERGWLWTPENMHVKEGRTEADYG